MRAEHERYGPAWLWLRDAMQRGTAAAGLVGLAANRWQSPLLGDSEQKAG